MQKADLARGFQMSSGLNAAQGLNWANTEILYTRQDDRRSCTYRIESRGLFLQLKPSGFQRKPHRGVEKLHQPKSQGPIMCQHFPSK